MIERTHFPKPPHHDDPVLQRELASVATYPETDGRPLPTLVDIFGAPQALDKVREELDETRDQLDGAREKAGRLAEKLREMGVEPDEI